MEYKYPPLYKYIAFFIILFLFMRHYKQITSDKYLIVSILITLLLVALDYMIISNSPPLLSMDEPFEDDPLEDILDDSQSLKESSHRQYEHNDTSQYNQYNQYHQDDQDDQYDQYNQYSQYDIEYNTAQSKYQ